MHVFRSVGLAAAVGASALLLLVGAAGAKTIVKVGGVASPTIVAFTTTPHTLSVKLDFDFSTDVPDTDPATVKQAEIFFPHGYRTNGALFPSCDPKRLRRLQGSPSACPRGSRLGSGTAVGTSPQFHGITERLKVDVYNARHGRGILLYLRGLRPVAIGGLVDASFVPIHTRRWGYKLTAKVPAGLQKLGSGIYASLLHMTTKVGASIRVHGVRHGFIEALACPPGALVPLHSVWSFVGGGSADGDGYISCGPR